MSGFRFGFGFGFGRRRSPAVPAGPAAETTALVARMTTPPSAGRQTLIDNCIKALKTAGVWSKLDALYFMAAADAQAAALNWKDSTYNLTFGAATTFTADQGVLTLSGTNGEIDTGFNPSTAPTPLFTLNSASMGFTSRTDAQSAGYDMGIAATLLVNSRTTADLFAARLNDGTLGTVANTSSVGFFSISRVASNNKRYFKDGALVLNNANVSTALGAANITIGIANTLRAARQYSMAFIGSGLSDAEMLALHNAAASYRTGVGA